MKHPLIILHGWGLSGNRFQTLAGGLKSKGYRVYAPDFPGFGSSPIPTKPFTLADYARFLKGFIQEHALARPILLGHSFGGRVALKYQALYPGSTSALILTGTPGFTPVPRRKLLLFIAIAKIGKIICTIAPLGMFQDAIRKWYYYIVGAREFYRAQGSMRETFKNIVREDLTEYMKAVHVPCLLIWGENDQITPLWIAKSMKECITGAKLVIIPNADHGVSFKEPKRFIEAASDFFNSL